MSKDIVWFDLETTGLSTSKDRIIEICMIKTDEFNNEKEKYYTLVNPGPNVDIAPGAQEKHGISIEELEYKPLFSEIATQVYEFIKGCDLGGYNILRFDLPMLIEELMRCNIIINHRKINVIDPLLIYSTYESRQLEAAYKKYTGKDLKDAHKAESDIRATMEIFLKQKDLYDMPLTAEEIDKEVNTYRQDTVDLDGKFKFIDTEDGGKDIVFNFGKHSGTSVKEVCKKDARYMSWIITKGEFSKETKIIADKLLKKFS